jgi:hypothetical protein
MRIHVTTRAHLFEERKRQHIERGYRIEDERPIPVNGLCSFIAVKDLPVQDTLSALVAEAVNGNPVCAAQTGEKSDVSQDPLSL